jgi:hypothetical protein
MDLLAVQETFNTFLKCQKLRELSCSVESLCKLLAARAHCEKRKEIYTYIKVNLEGIGCKVIYEKGLPNI